MTNDEVARRRKYRRNKARRKHLKVFFIFFFIFALVIGTVLSVTVLFPIKTIVIEGNSRYEQVHIKKYSNALDKNIFTVNGEKIEQNLRKKLPYIDSVSISRKLPDTLTIKVSDATEYVSYNVGGKHFAVSKKGYVLNEYENVPDNLFEIKVKNVECEIGNLLKFENEKTKENIDVLLSESENRKITINSVDMTDNNNIKLKVMNRFNVIMGSGSYLQNKVAHLGGMIKNISEAETGEINLSMWTPENSEGTYKRSVKNDE